MIAKTQKELDILREGGKRLATHVATLAKLVVPGVSSRELEEKALAMVAADGDTPAFLGYKSHGDKHGYPSALCLSVNDVIVHSPAAVNDVVIQDGDVVTLDFGIKHGGLFTDHAVTVIAGTGSAADIRLVRGTEEALAAGIAQARIGNTTGDIGYAVEQVAKKYGFGFPRNLAGHGVGKKVHEEPHVMNFGARRSGERLVEGLVIAIEPMMTLGSGELYIDKDGHSYRTEDGSRSAHSEHTVIVTKEGPEVITRV